MGDAIPAHYFIALFFEAICLIIGWRSLPFLDRPLKILVVFIGVSFLIDVLLYPIQSIWGNNLWLFHLFTLFEFIIFMHVFSNWQKPKLALFLKRSVYLFLLIWLGSKIWLEDFYNMDNYTSSLASLVISMVSLYTMVTLIMESLKVSIYNDAKFWVSTGVLIYYGGNIFTFALSSIFVFWPIHNIIQLISLFCYSKGFLCQRRM